MKRLSEDYYLTANYRKMGKEAKEGIEDIALKMIDMHIKSISEEKIREKISKALLEYNDGHVTFEIVRDNMEKKQTELMHEIIHTSGFAKIMVEKINSLQLKNSNE